METNTAAGEAGLRVFLLERLALLGGGGGEGGARALFKTQRVMLCTWLLELYLKRLAALGAYAYMWVRVSTECSHTHTYPPPPIHQSTLLDTAPSDAADDDDDTSEASRKQEEEYDALSEELRAFLQTHIEDLRLHPPTTYELLASHGRKQVRAFVGVMYVYVYVCLVAVFHSTLWIQDRNNATTTQKNTYHHPNPPSFFRSF